MEPESNQDDDKSPAQTKSQNSINDKTKKNKKRKQITTIKEKSNKKKRMSKSKPKSNSITKSGDDNFENSDDEGDINDDDEEKEANEEIPIMTKLVTSLCKCLTNTGIVVNMDNLYSSPELFIKLREMGIYARGTFRKYRKYLPKFI